MYDNMLNFLYSMQIARESWASFLNIPLFAISEFAYYCLVIITVILYMCVDKKKYVSLFFAYSLSNFLMCFIKLIACVYRPWILDSRLHPSDLISHSATGYSFPSGHTTSASSFYGSIGYETYRNKKTAATILFAVLICLTAFSRIWLGAHTPLDVIVAIVLGIVSVALVEWILAYINAHPDKDYMLTVGCFIIVVCSLIYFSLKSYPMDYAPDGSLLADPIKMQMDSWQSAGMLLGVSVCWLIDRRFINFTTDISKKRKIIRGVIALVMFALLYMVLLKKLETAINPLIGSFIRSFVSLMICLGAYPAIFTRWEAKHSQQCC